MKVGAPSPADPSVSFNDCSILPRKQQLDLRSLILHAGQAALPPLDDWWLGIGNALNISVSILENPLMKSYDNLLEQFYDYYISSHHGYTAFRNS
jgi:hypothetical protein